MKEIVYRVIASYPFNKYFVVGQIIRLTEIDGREHSKQEQYAIVYSLDSSTVISETMAFYESEFDAYPHIFEKISK